MEPVPLPDDATDVLFSLFAETGMAEICELQNALATLVHDQHALSRRLAFRKAKALLAQGHAFALLKEDPSFSPEHLADERAFRRASGIVALASMLYQTAGDSEPEYASLIEKPPCPLSRLFLWMDFVHPMRRHPIPPHKVSGIILSICSIYSSLACYRHELFVSSLRENPRAMLQIIDIWLHYPLYLQGANGGRLTAAASVVLAARPLLHLFFGNPRTYMHSTFFAELNALAGRRRYVLDSIASQSHFLTSISAVSPTWTWLWRDHLLVALMLTHSLEFYGVLVPRGVLRALMSCVTKLIDNTTSRDRDLRETAAVASDLILSFLKHTNDTRNVLRAVKAGLFPFLRTLDAAFDTHMESVAALKNYMADCVSLPSILRPLVKANPELAQETPQSDLTSRFARLYDNARRHRVLYGRLQDVNPWILHIPCGNVFKVCRTLDVD
ncbi:uncharacterized protein SCHCODRAFT_02626690 [Schizophyllum commune H4-8]|uniref:uncharacterized protein n=1 Tax=Schizophyllum commune (strain H4-8 / FGSC 9210) TaxID=578458 RepID=UPI00215E0E3A|nr:uncharacterized protein SCHCODRAFT_02626690 [Schizophyllum commune H4-8]KAI5892634.1 hypothetical protein SCHCODRAFT_02626690 [Schizophyllum commune H4-8]